MKGKILATAILALLAFSALLTVIPSTLAATTTFGQSTQSSATSTALNTALGARYTSTNIPGQAQSISAYIGFSPATSKYFGQKTVALVFNTEDIENHMRGRQFTTDSVPVYAKSVSAFIWNTGTEKMMKAAIYTVSGSLVASSNERSIATGALGNEWTFDLTSPVVLSPSTTYVMVVWSASGDGAAALVYQKSGSNGREYSASWGSWPASISVSAESKHNYFIWVNYDTAANVQCAIYSADGSTLLGVTEQKALTSTTSGWTTFNFNTKPTLNADTQYVLAAWSNNPAVNLYYTGTSAQGFTGSGSSIPATLSTSGTRNYNLYASTAYQTITVVQGAGGTINPPGTSGTVNVAYGASQSFSITPNPGYHIANIKVDGSPVVADTSYTFPSVTSDHTIAADFAITQVATTLTVACTPDTVDRSGSMITTVSGTLTTSGGAPIAGKPVALTYNTGTEQPITMACTQADGSYSYTWTAPSSLPNGHYVITAAYTGDNNPYQSSTAQTTVGGGGLFVVPEYALGALGAVFSLFAAFGLVQVRRKRNLNP